jgi:hypothetical protein
MESLDFWRLCDELTIVQAALLIVGEDPTDKQDSIERKVNESKPEGYEALKTALMRAALSDKIISKKSFYETFDNIPYLNCTETTLDVISLKAWLREKGFLPKFFFPDFETTSDEFLDPKNPNYAPKLAAAVNAWLTISKNPALAKGKTVKQSLMKWLRENSKEYGFNNEEGFT